MFKLDSDFDGSRYDIARFISNENGSILDSVDSEFLYRVKNLSRFGNYTVISEIGRPDLLSERIYGNGNHQLWWILMFVNDLRYPWELTMNLILRYPLMDDLEDIYLTLSPTIGSSSGTTTTQEVIT